jgi:hypothetical protein
VRVCAGRMASSKTGNPPTTGGGDGEFGGGKGSPWDSPWPHRLVLVRGGVVASAPQEGRDAIKNQRDALRGELAAAVSLTGQSVQDLLGRGMSDKVRRELSCVASKGSSPNHGHRAKPFSGLPRPPEWGAPRQSVKNTFLDHVYRKREARGPTRVVSR